MPEGGPELIRAASHQIEVTTGLALVQDVGTDEPVATQPSSVQPGRHGDRWAPVLFAVTDDATMAALGGDVAAMAEPTTIAPAGPGSARCGRMPTPRVGGIYGEDR